MQADVLACNTAGLFAFQTLLASTAGYEGNNRHAVADSKPFDILPDPNDFAGRIDTLQARMTALRAKLAAASKVSPLQVLVHDVDSSHVSSLCIRVRRFGICG